MIDRLEVAAGKQGLLTAGKMGGQGHWVCLQLVMGGGGGAGGGVG